MEWGGTRGNQRGVWEPFGTKKKHYVCVHLMLWSWTLLKISHTNIKSLRYFSRFKNVNVTRLNKKKLPTLAMKVVVNVHPCYGLFICPVTLSNYQHISETWHFYSPYFYSLLYCTGGVDWLLLCVSPPSTPTSLGSDLHGNWDITCSWDETSASSVTKRGKGRAREGKGRVMESVGREQTFKNHEKQLFNKDFTSFWLLCLY